MNTIQIDDKLINLDKIHFIRRESKTELIISFGTDFVRIKNSPDEIESLFKNLQVKTHAKFSH